MLKCFYFYLNVKKYTHLGLTRPFKRVIRITTRVNPMNLWPVPVCEVRGHNLDYIPFLLKNSNNVQPNMKWIFTKPNDWLIKAGEAERKNSTKTESRVLCHAQLPSSLSHSSMANLNLNTDSPLSRRIVRAFLNFLNSGSLSIFTLFFNALCTSNFIMRLDCEFFNTVFDASFVKWNWIPFYVCMYVRTDHSKI